MPPDRGLRPLSIDLSSVHRRSVTSLFSNLVTRPTGRAIRTGVESQIAEMGGEPAVCLSVLDFSQVRVLDYSCADEVVAKLLLRFLDDARPAEAFFLLRGVQEHHLEAIDAVLERHDLLLVAEDAEGRVHLLGPANPLQRAVWTALDARGRAEPDALAEAAGLGAEAVRAALESFARRRVAAVFADGTVAPLHRLEEVTG